MVSNLAASNGLRERNKARRRDAILDAALDLLDEPHGSVLTTERIAEVAEVSVATVYNLVGTREQLLLALVDRLIAGLVVPDRGGAASRRDDPLTRLRDVLDASVSALTSRPIAYQRVFLQLAAVASPETHTKLSPAAATAVELRRAQAAGLIRDDLDVEALALQSYLSYNGALLRWAAGALSDRAFRAAVRHGLATVLAAGATTRTRSRFLDDLRDAGHQIGAGTTAGG